MEILAHSASILETKSQVSLVISLFTALYGAFSDVIGKKTMMQFYMMITFVRKNITLFSASIFMLWLFSATFTMLKTRV